MRKMFLPAVRIFTRIDNSWPWNPDTEKTFSSLPFWNFENSSSMVGDCPHVLTRPNGEPCKVGIWNEVEAWICDSP